MCKNAKPARQRICAASTAPVHQCRGAGCAQSHIFSACRPLVVDQVGAADGTPRISRQMAGRTFGDAASDQIQ